MEALLLWGQPGLSLQLKDLERVMVFHHLGELDLYLQ